MWDCQKTKSTAKKKWWITYKIHYIIRNRKMTVATRPKTKSN